MNKSKVINCLLTKNNICENDIFSILNDAYTKYVDYSDLYFQNSESETWVLENKIVKEGIYNIDIGFGMRSISNITTSFSYSNIISLNALHKTLQILKQNNTTNTINHINKKKIDSICSYYRNSNPYKSLTEPEKIKILYDIDRIARSTDSRVSQVNAVLSSFYENILVASTDGNLATDVRPLISLSIQVVVESNGKREMGRMGGGRRDNYTFLLKKSSLSGELLFEEWTKEAVRIALTQLSSKDAPSGMIPVVLGSGWPGVLLHEAVGHGLEGDFNRKKISVFSNKIGKKVASSLCTVVDDGTIYSRRGTLNIDDEGVSTKYNVLIENGILKSYMQDKFNARLMGDSISTGNARRQSYAYLPMPRMTNTYMLPGNTNVLDIINSVDYGIYAKNFSGGQVDITSGDFVFSTSEAYLILHGKIMSPIKKTMLIGSGIEVMNKISMVGNDLALDEGVGTCVKEGQSIPVGVGQPTLKIDALTVGGTKK
ncbi:metalloprotease TldD [Buchnera aphidicola (Thelaxes californica)]|uniref:Metalloprotease TldD n=1 Tax=Buchnera aphidicola (Thelaxes californica) TaxID=1315998 RepID=A0A4D6Y9Y7_9GAMM|nr:metalloprotease TldD [Buchnera aphidicola]QCI26836.1 metalloprotease TldD [Buchnera aphidicola (Thelaxes californica)]